MDSDSAGGGVLAIALKQTGSPVSLVKGFLSAGTLDSEVKSRLRLICNPTVLKDPKVLLSFNHCTVLTSLVLAEIVSRVSSSPNPCNVVSD